MGVLTINGAPTGMIGNNPNFAWMSTTDDFATITTAGYLNAQQNFYAVPINEQTLMFTAYNVVTNTGSADTDIFSCSVATNGQVTLTPFQSADVPAYVEGITPGTAAASKALVLDSGSAISGQLWTAYTNAALLNGGVTAGTSAASKVLSLSAGNLLNSVAIADITSAGTYVNGLTAGTPAASRALTLNASSQLSGVAIAAITQAGTLTTGQWSGVTTVSTTPASGSCAAQFQLINIAGNIGSITAGDLYLSDVNGAMVTAQTSIVVLTNGAIQQTGTGRTAGFTSTAAGLLGLTLTAAAGTYYIAFKLPSGKPAISSALVVNA
jgi:hypothetical protein